MVKRSRREAWMAPLALLLGLPGTAWAGDQPLYRPIPDWVVPVPENASQNPASPAADQQLRIFDFQQRINHGEVWSYVDSATHLATPEALAQSGTIALSWAPDHGDLIIHAITILRAGKRIDALAGGAKFTILRREAQLEALQLNGILTATLEVEGLQVGDVLETRYSVTQRDPALAGHAAATAPLIALPAQLGFGRARVLWASDDAVRWKTYLDGVTPHETTHAGWHELSVGLPVAKQPDPAPQAPGRFAHPPMIEFSDFADWADVSRTMAPLYRPDATTAAITSGGELDRAIAAIAAASQDARKRTAMALQLVQDKIRYFAVSMNGGNLVPQTPEQTWAKRYGDCKAKTLLLLTILHKLGIDAEPALASIENGDLVHDRLPSALAFDHIFVLAHVGGATLWLDGTGLGTREPDLDDVYPYHWVLPLRAAGAALIEAPAKPPARATIEGYYEADMRGGLGLLAPGHIHVVVRGAGAGQLNAQLVNLDKEAKADALRKILYNAEIYRIFAAPQFTYDAVTGIATIDADCVTMTRWSRADNRYSYDPKIFEASQFPDRSRGIWQAIPVTMGGVEHSFYDAKISLPNHGAGIAMEGSADLQLAQPGLGASSVHAELHDGIWHYTGTNRKDGGEFPASAIPAMRKQDADIVAKAPKLRTVAGYPPAWQGVEAAKRMHLYDRTLTILSQFIAEKPEDAERYQARAAFYAAIFERQKAIADLGKALALNADKVTYRQRAGLYTAIGDKQAALADAKAAFDLDPSDLTTLNELTHLLAITGGKEDALARIDAALANGGDNEPTLLGMKAWVLANTGDGPGALAAIDAAVEKRSGNAQRLNERCWLRGLLNTDLDAALADCTRAIQLSDTTAPQALDSRALVEFRQHHLKEALADLNTALDLRPAQDGSYFLRALVEREAGNAEAATRDVVAARLLLPTVEESYARFGLHW